jgi:hypothetical protein
VGTQARQSWVGGVRVHDDMRGQIVFDGKTIS